MTFKLPQYIATRTIIPLLVLLAGITPAHAQSSRSEALLDQAQEHMQQFLTDEHWAAVRNLTGVARAIFIMPKGGQFGFVVGTQWGKGILLVRHHHQWSHPLFVEINSLQIGLLAGAQSVSGIGILLSDAALKQVINGEFKAGGSADLTLGPGVSGKAAGGVKGIEMLMVSSNKGVFLGGSFEGVQLKLDEAMNQDAYGDNFDVTSIANFNEQPLIPLASSLRQQLADVAYNAVFNPTRLQK